MRWGPGPVFVYECLTGSRRWQGYALRSIGVAALLFAMGTIAWSRMTPLTGDVRRDYARLGEAYFHGLIGVELAIVLFAAPASTAGAICFDRARGTLAHMLMTDLSDAEIVLGKLGARLIPVMGLIACSWPVMAISTLLGGIDPIALTWAFAIVVSVAIFGCALALTLSVWVGKAHEVILVTYTVFLGALLVWPIWMSLSTSGVCGPPPDWPLLFNPFYVAFAPYDTPGMVGNRDCLVFFAATLGASALLASLAVWKMRAMVCRDPAARLERHRLGRLGRLARLLPGPSLDRNPILWREWHRSRPSRWMTAIVVLLMGTTGALSLVGAVEFWRNGVDIRWGVHAWEIAGVCAYVLHVSVGLTIMSAIAPTSLAEERQRGSLDLLASTALSTRAIVIGKWIGVFRLAIPLAVCPAVIALAMATAQPGSPPPAGMPPEYNETVSLGARLLGAMIVVATILAHAALIASIGVALAVWIKRQSRAIAISVSLFVLVTAAWPIFIQIALSEQGFLGRDLACLSPVATCGMFVNFFNQRNDDLGTQRLWWSSFWALEVFAFALGLLWLAIRTFDDCFDRIPERRSRAPIMASMVAILAAMLGACSLVWAIGAWLETGVPTGVNSAELDGIMVYTLAIVVGLVLVAVEAMISIRAMTRLAPAAMEPLPESVVRPSIIARWRESFRLVLMLAAGPALVALALAVAYKPIQSTAVTPIGQVITWIEPDSAESHPERVGLTRLPARLILAAIVATSVLAHGAAAVSVGFALAAPRRRSRLILATAIGLGLVRCASLPLFPGATEDRDLAGLAMSNVATVVDSSLVALDSGGGRLPRELFRGALISNCVAILLAVGLFKWTIREWRRRKLGLPDEGLIDMGCHHGPRPESVVTDLAHG